MSLVAELQRHLAHRLSKSEVREKRLRRLVVRSGPENDARRAAFAQPLDCRLDQFRSGAGASRLYDYRDIVNESRRTAQLFPRHRLERSVDIADDNALSLGDEDAAIG